MQTTRSQEKLLLPIPIYLLFVGARFVRSFYVDFVRPRFNKADVWVAKPTPNARCVYFASVLFEQTNEYREMLGLPLLCWSDTLAVDLLILRKPVS